MTFESLGLSPSLATAAATLGIKSPNEIQREALPVALRGDRARPKLEASGGVNLDTVAGIAETGVDFMSVGAITHSVKALDLALDFVTRE